MKKIKLIKLLFYTQNKKKNLYKFWLKLNLFWLI